MKYIFDEIIETKNVYLVIDEIFPDGEEKIRTITIIKDVIHHKIVDMVLDELDEEKRLIFLEKLDNAEEHSSILSNLSEWIQNFEHKVITKVKEAETELIKLISEK